MAGNAQPAGTAGSIDKEALRRKYAEERAKRLRPDGNEQYQRLEGKFAAYAEDPHMPVKPREPLRDHVTFAFIGGGFAGLVAGARLAERGITDVRIIEKGGDFGGTWYWNRYPGAQCDTASMIYMPLLEETGHMPTEKYAHGPEILEHCQRIGRQYGLYENALFHTEVEALEWDEAAHRWIIRTNRCDEFTAQFLGMGTGPLHVAKLPGIEGIGSFEGQSFHTSRWDYGYTGGDPSGAPMTGLSDKRVAIIGTGATSVQCVPHLARAAKELYVFQRTPSSIDVRNNQPIDPEWFADVAQPGWQKRWLENFTANQAAGPGASEDLVQDGWTDIAKRLRARIFTLPPEKMNPEGMMSAFEDADFEKMEEIRGRVDQLVEDPETAQSLKAWYRQLCKRPCFHDAYLQAFNTPGTHLIDTGGKGVDRITETGLVAGGKEYPVDCIIYASGFEVGTDYTARAGYDPVGRGGVRLSEYWADGMRTKHGIHVRGFPNMFVVQPTQGANLISNIPHNLTESGATIAAIVDEAIRRDAAEVEVTQEAERQWIDLLLSGPGMMIGAQDCTPGYYNNEGQEPGPKAKLSVGYPAGAMAYFKYIQDWRDSGKFDGLEFH
ncbi:flavin-containing monooxygenase [Pontixanthobacter luteolus]|uniref:flavin-containing monooxygenase n=1 Tax=Pontixanthobacter luteolus TaxID=295089 RepID=UPI0023023E54|nr:NAD(P)/FAD-dependent oxidoreductase [Pontixanthobacter luteolus]